MLAVFKTGGKQYSVKAGQILKVEKLEGGQGDSIAFNDILIVSDDKNHTVGNPLVKGASITAKILEQIRDKKIIVFKKRKRQNYRHSQGHRQYLTVLQIESIVLGEKKSLAPLKKIKTQPAEEKSKEIKNDKSKIIPSKKTAAPKKTAVVKKQVLKKNTKTKKESK